MALTTYQFWQKQLTIHQAAQAAASTGLAAAQARQGSATAQLATDVAELTRLSSVIASQRALLATVTVPAAANALVATITANQILQRTQQGKVLDDQDAVADAGAAAVAAAATLARASARIATVQAAITQAQADGKQRDALKAAITTPPLDTITADATAMLAGPTASHAALRIAADFPTKILEIAQKRHDRRRSRLASLATVSLNADHAQTVGLTADDGLDGAVAGLLIAFQRAQQALADAIRSAPTRQALALAVLQKIEAIQLDTTGTVPDLLTDAEKAQLTAPAMVTAGAAAESTAVTLDGDLGAVFTAEDALAAQVLTQIGTDVDQLASAAAVAAARTAIVAARSTFRTHLGTFAAGNKGDLDQWEAVIPDSTWKALLDYLAGLADLAAIAATDFGALATAMDTAEDAYTTALAAAELAKRRADARADAVAIAKSRLENFSLSIANRMPSAVRGDSY
jgi:hypothetical protein